MLSNQQATLTYFTPLPDIDLQWPKGERVHRPVTNITTRPSSLNTGRGLHSDDGARSARAVYPRISANCEGVDKALAITLVAAFRGPEIGDL